MKYCFCGGEFKISKKQIVCHDEGTFLLITWKCKLCGKCFESDLIERELDWEGLK